MISEPFEEEVAPIGSAHPPIRRTTQAEFIRIQLEERIHRGLLKPGDALDETQLAKEFAVSRTPVREALRQLEAIGIVGTRGRQGSMVAVLSRQEVWETVELLVELFVYAMRLAAVRATPELRRHIAAKLATGFSAAASESRLDAFKPYVHELRMTIVEAGGNDVLTREITVFWQRLIPFRRPDDEMPADYVERVMESMGHVVAAVLAGDPDEVERLLRLQAQIVTVSIAGADPRRIGLRAPPRADIGLRS